MLPQVLSPHLTFDVGVSVFFFSLCHPCCSSTYPQHPFSAPLLFALREIIPLDVAQLQLVPRSLFAAPPPLLLLLLLLL
jgi:hypothetical protein